MSAAEVKPDPAADAALSPAAQAYQVIGLAAVVVKTALRDMLAQAEPEDAAAEAQSHHDPDHDVPVAVHGSTPPGEHLSSLLDH